MNEVLGLPQHLAGAERCLVMGVLNVTPDSFSDGGRWLDRDQAVEHGLRLRAQGADIVDVGGESTRPGAARVDASQEKQRILPVVEQLVGAGVVVSVDTMRAEVAGAALEAGAHIINDVSGGLVDPGMPGLIRSSAVPYVVMHWRAPSDRMDRAAVYDDVVTEVIGELRARLRALVDAGIDPRQLIVDPGLGFSKDIDHNWSLMAGLDRLHDLGRPILLGASRKRFLAAVTAAPDGSAVTPDARDDATTATTALAASAGVWCVRVHDVRPSLDAVRVAAALGSADRPWSLPVPPFGEGISR
ncbi:MAG: dihydropteroate synthase [Actinomycetota bacterium]|nr:dihydropteroate synthase [Actinomycetota bacterium]